MDVDFLRKSRVFSFYTFFASLPNFWKKRIQIYIAKKWYAINDRLVRLRRLAIRVRDDDEID